MGALTSAIFSEIYLQYIEHTSIIDILTKNTIHGYYLYVDDIPIIHDIELTNKHNVLKRFNTLSPKLTFTIEEEREKQISFLDITIKREQKQFTFNIYRKSTITDHVIPNDSCHPQEHKVSAIQYLANRMESYSIGKINNLKENQIIQHILQANKYNPNLPHPNKHKRRQHNQTESMQPIKWVKFTYLGRETRAINQIFQKAGIKIAYTTKRTIRNLLSQFPNQPNQYETSGVYQLTCLDCGKFYVGQTDRRLKLASKNTNETTTKIVKNPIC
jgi:hypothetical protein